MRMPPGFRSNRNVSGAKPEISLPSMIQKDQALGPYLQYQGGNPNRPATWVAPPHPIAIKEEGNGQISIKKIAMFNLWKSSLGAEEKRKR